MAVNALSGIIGQMTNVYRESQASMATSLARVAAGSRITKASDDTADYVSMVKAQTDKTKYEVYQKGLAKASGTLNSALNAANDVMSDLKKLKEYYVKADTDGAAAIKASIVSKIAATDGEGGVILRLGYGNATDVTGATFAMTATGVLATGTEADAAAVDARLGTMATFVSEVSALKARVDSQKSFASVAADNAQAFISSLTEIDEAKELANSTDQDIRQQAAISMLAQSNMSRQNITMLYR